MNKEHIHTLERMKTRNGRTDLYRCLHPKCTFYAPATQLLGKYALCKLCQSQYIFNQESIRRKVPHCGCRQLTPEQRAKLLSLTATEESTAELAMQILQAGLRKGME